MNRTREERDRSEDGAPPFFSTWKRMYAFVLAFLALLIILFSFFSISFR